MAGEGTYQWSLDDDSLKKAAKELNEDSKQRASQIDSLRTWVKKQPHLTSRTDDAFLLRFLRTSKFSMLRAQQMLDKFCTVRSSQEKGVPLWFNDLDPEDPKILELLDIGTCLPLPGRDDQNRKVMLYRTGAFDPKVHDFSDVMRLGFITTDILLMDELNQIHGFVILLDFSEFGMSHVTCWGPDTVSKAMMCWQDCYPTRNKAINYYNTPTLFNVVFELFKLVMKEKYKQRLHFHWSSQESLHKQVPQRMLPTYMGGTAGTLQEIIQDWKVHVLKNKEEISRNARCAVDEEKRPAPEKDGGEGGWGIVGSFRKLALD
ncbi:alpha-tocopherol transfer protein-like [Lingula anatina]|uniref:Alpha-tocopherol transfer protein-like n=1 Tax=Lingula anatina TaxID=7574 RepID=A0A1S3JPM4_LINAN|nr:alpha-tocopherol transfer protein-like [Lingula anatina]XP_013412325.1 alpha-tocopherol transfer protein-like [Lingula anatina]|eukprot:XP_013412324.1 alpha-tocopherol transfer protein-like [Lingula anatina]